MQHGTREEQLLDILENVEAVLIGEALRRGLPLGDVIENLHTGIGLARKLAVDAVEELKDRDEHCKRCGGVRFYHGPGSHPFEVCDFKSCTPTSYSIR